MKVAVLTLMLALTAFAQDRFEVKDRTGKLVASIEKLPDFDMFRDSSYFNGVVFRTMLKNELNEPLSGAKIVGGIQKKDGQIITFVPQPITDDLKLKPFPRVFAGDFNQQIAYVFPSGTNPSDFRKIEFFLTDGRLFTTKPGFHVSGFIAKDEGCFKDYLETQKLAGLALRKRLAELLEYGCGFVVERPEAVAVALRKTFVLSPQSKVAGANVMLTEEEAIALDLDIPSRPFRTGWVPASALEAGGVLTLGDEIGIRKDK